MEPACWLALILAGIAGGLVAFLLASLHRVLRPPERSPREHLKRVARGLAGDSPVLVAIGDSITHGHASADFVAMLRQRLAARGQAIEVVNAGINSELAWNVNRRLDDIIACDPAVVTILIGTNDANCILREQTLKIAMREMKLPRVPDLPWFEENLTALIDRLQRETRARIAVLSIPTIGEDPADRAFQQGATYARAVKAIADRKGTSYIPLHETMKAMLAANPSKPRVRHDQQIGIMVRAIIANRFGRSWDEIGRKNGFSLHCDFLHLNETGAALVAGLIESWLVENPAA